MTTTRTRVENRLTHWTQCTDPRPANVVTFKGSRGDLMNRCEVCRRISLADTLAPDTPAPAALVEASQPAGARFWAPCARCERDVWPNSSRRAVHYCAACRRTTTRREDEDQ